MGVLQESVSTQNYGTALTAASRAPTGNVRSPLSGLPTRGVILNAPDLEDCTVDSNELQAITITVPAGLHAVADVLVTLDKPARTIIVASIGPSQPVENSSLFLHLIPLGKQNFYNSSGTPNVITPDGTEPWFEIHNADLAGTVFKSCTYITFRKPISKFYLDIGNEGTIPGIRNYTFFCTDDVLDIYIRPHGDVSG